MYATSIIVCHIILSANSWSNNNVHEHSDIDIFHIEAR
jgi:hypothetical protein